MRYYLGLFGLIAGTCFVLNGYYMFALLNYASAALNYFIILVD